jgi:hypothetical protein
MFISEIFALPVYYIKNRKLKKETIKEGDKENSEGRLLIQANKKKRNIKYKVNAFNNNGIFF